ncbi:MAG: exosome complex RNA-binding protein Csl4 [archaeon]
MAKNNEIILPGEFLATEEEYAPGRNARAQEGRIISTTVGRPEFDETKKIARVLGKTIRELKEGDTIMGQVMLVKESSAQIHLLFAENNKKITGITVAQLPIRNVSNEYVTDLKKKIKIGDLIRAKVMQANELGIDLSTKEKGFGVIKAHCTNCRTEMNYAEGKLTCQNCGSVEERKWFEAEDNYAPRQGGFERREGHGGGFRGNDRRGGFRGNDRRGSFGGGHGGGHSGGFGSRREGSGGFGERRSFNDGDRTSGQSTGRRSFDGPRREF